MKKLEALKRLEELESENKRLRAEAKLNDSTIQMITSESNMWRETYNDLLKATTGEHKAFEELKRKGGDIK